jgi:hypothetical protein
VRGSYAVCGWAYNKKPGAAVMPSLVGLCSGAGGTLYCAKIVSTTTEVVLSFIPLSSQTY